MHSNPESDWLAAAIQMVSSGSLEQNLDCCSRLVRKAAAAGCRLVSLPENFALMASGTRYRELGEAESTASGPVRSRLAELARETGMYLLAGSLPDARRPDGTAVPDRVRSVSRLYAPDGVERVRYDKIHLFDAQVGDAHGTYRESEHFEPGDRVCSAALDEMGMRLGLSICYDLRFPALYMALRDQNADLLSVPAAFTHATGEAHWAPLLRARAIETQSWVIAAGQGGLHDGGRKTWGHSMIIDPWGRIVAERRDEGAGLVMASISPARVAQIRTQMPVATHRRVFSAGLAQTAVDDAK